MLKHFYKFSKNQSLLRSFLKYGVAAILLAVPLYPKFPFLTVPGTYVSIRLEDFLLLIVSFIWFLYELPRFKNLYKDPISKSIIIFICVGFVSLLWAVLVTKSVVLHIGVLHWLRRIEYFLCFFIGISVIKSQKDLAFFVKCLLILVFYSFVYGFLQKHFNLPVIITQNFEYSKGVALRFMPGGHLVSTFAGHYDLASVLLLVMPMFFTIFFTPFEKLRKVRLVSSTLFFRIILFLGVSAGFWLLINTVSRISIAAYMLSVSFALLLYRKILIIPIFIIITILVLSTSTSLIDRYTRVFEVYFQKMVSPIRSLNPVKEVYAARTNTPTPVPVPVFEDRSTSIRLNVEWPRALRALRKNPLLGTGYSSITLATDNDYLRLLGEVGILGFVSFVIIFIQLGLFYAKNLSLIKRKDLAASFLAGMIAATCGILLNAVFIDIFEASKFAIIFWLLTGLTVGVVNRINLKRNA